MQNHRYHNRTTTWQMRTNITEHGVRTLHGHDDFGNNSIIRHAGLNTAVGIGSVFGGPIGATIGATYGLIDYQWNGDWGQFFRDSADGWSSILGRNSAKQPCDNKGSKK